MRISIFLSMLALLTPAVAEYTQPAPFALQENVVESATVQLAPRFEKYRVSYGNKMLEFNEGGTFCIRSDGQELARFYLFFTSKFSNYFSVNSNKVVEHNFVAEPEKQRYTWTMKIPVYANVSRSEVAGYADYRQALTVEGARMNFEMEYSVSGLDEFEFRTGHVSMLLNSMVYTDRKALMISEKEKNELELAEAGKGHTLNKAYDTVMIGAGNPLSEIMLSSFRPGSMQLLFSKKQEFLIRLLFGKDQRKLNFTMDFGKVLPPLAEKAGESYEGIKFWKNDRLRVPDFTGPENNLIQNSSFEAGMRYYTVTGRFCAPSNQPLEITDKEAKFGRHSMQMTVRRNDTKAGSFTTFGLPMASDQTYTLSFYAKAEKPGMKVKFFGTTARWGTFLNLKPINVVPGEWQRYSYSFRQPNNGASMTFGAEYSGNDPEAKIWFDGLKLEKGDTATEYIEPKLAVMLSTSAADNFIPAGTPVKASLKLRGAAGLSGTVAVSVRDCFHRELWTRTLPFTIGEKGGSILPLELENTVGNGVFVLATGFTFADGSKYTDYMRFARMKFLDNTHCNKDIFGNQIRLNAFDREKIAERNMRIGIGSTSYKKSKEDYELLWKYRISDSGRGMAERIRIKGREYNPFKVGDKVYIEDFNKIGEVTPEIARIVEEGAYAAAAASPWVDKWFISGENGAGRYDLLLPTRKFGEFAKLLHAVYRGVKRFDSRKTVLLDGGPTNMSPVGGIRYIDDVLTAAGLNTGIKFDMLAIHPYRETPERPDLDADTAALLVVMKKHGYGDAPVTWNEGAYYTPSNLPEWGLNPHAGCSTDHYRLYSVSYDMGWGEYISAAYTARSYLVALKYQKNIRSLNTWSGWCALDIDQTPMQLQTVSNTLGQLFGNAEFSRDIRFAPQVRCYVFEDSQKRPVAALWSYIREVDHGLKVPPRAKFDFKGSLESALDINSNPIDAASGVYGVTSMPIFLVGKPGSMNEFCAALSAGILTGGTASPLGVTIGVTGPETAKVTVTNLLDRPFNGEWTFAGEKRHLELAGAKSADFQMKLPQPLTDAKITQYKLPASWQSGSASYTQDFSFSGFACRKVSAQFRYDDPAAWSAFPKIPLTSRITRDIPGKAGDLEADIQTAWNDDWFFLCVNVVDDKFFPVPSSDDRSIKKGYNYDSLQLYFDTFCDARTRETPGHDGNDYNYDVIPVGNDKAVVYRRIAPEQQLANGLLAPKPDTIEPDVKCIFSRTENGYRYQLAFPRHLLEPMQFEENRAIGFSLMVNDNDGEKLRSSLTLNTVPEGCWMKPHLYPVMLLTSEKK